MHRFFIPSQSLNQAEVALPQEISRQIARVLRLEVGSQVVVLDGSGDEYTLSLVQVTPDSVVGKILKKESSRGEPRTAVHMFLALTQRERFEWMLQKCTEIGVVSFTPLVTARSLVHRTTEVEGKYLRWQKIIQEAAEQSHRGKVPLLNHALTFPEFVKHFLEPRTTGLFFWEEEGDNDLKTLLKSVENDEVNLVIGPEGGFTHEEADAVRGAGYISVSLGKRILRVETAAMIAAGLVLYELG
jgi:16S rRNA (uracil1498-N3)-methyltransferase